MVPEDIIFEHYEAGSPLAEMLIRHSEQVREKALVIAEKVPHLQPDRTFVSEAAMLHDIGIYRTATPQIGCLGDAPYICHGIIGRKILEKYDLYAHALVCERHVGVGICAADIEAQRLPLPKHDMLPISIEEIIVCYADKFFSKNNGCQAHPLETVITEVERYGVDQMNRFMTWHRLFSGCPPYPTGHQQK